MPSGHTNKLTMRTPAAWWGAKWREALPAGNGRSGAAVYGGAHTETIMLTHADLWWQSETPPMPDVSDKLPEVRGLLLEGRPDEAEPVLARTLKERGYEPTMAVPLPLGDIRLTVQGRSAFRDYSRTLDMETGEIAVRWLDGTTAYERVLFVSRTDDLIVAELRAGDAVGAAGAGSDSSTIGVDNGSSDSETVGAIGARGEGGDNDGGDAVAEGSAVREAGRNTAADGEAVQQAASAAIRATITLDLHDRTDVRRPPGRPESKLPELAETRADGDYVYYAARNDDGTDFGAVLRVARCEGGRITAADGTLTIDGAERVLLLIKLFVKGEREREWPLLREQLAGVQESYAELLQRHAAEHGRLFGGMSLDLAAEGRERSNEELLLDAYSGEAPDALVERMWAYGRYLLISSSREGGHPSHLYGMWCGEYRGFWAFNMANENLQMIYWQALSGGMPELLLAVFDYYERMMDDFRANARLLYGCRGIFIPAPTAPDSGLLKTVAPHIIHWTGAAGWIGQHYYDYYRYTGDLAFLRDRALPFLRETAQFYEDFFCVGEDGYYVSSPSNSPENMSGPEASRRCSTTVNATMDFAIAGEVLRHLIEGTRLIGGGDPADMARWEEMLSRIPPYRINEDGAVAEWMHDDYPDNYHHRHQSHLYPVFPGTEVTRERDPELYEAFETAVRKRLVVGLKQQTGWSLAHMANCYARMGDASSAIECLDILARSCVIPNLFTLHNDWRGMGVGMDLEWAPVQLDANMGWSAAVQEMLFGSTPGVIRVLPALPQRWPRGRASGMLACGGIAVSIEWDRAQGRLEIELISRGRDQQVELHTPQWSRSSGEAAPELWRLQGDTPLRISLRADGASA